VSVEKASTIKLFVEWKKSQQNRNKNEVEMRIK